MFKSDYVLSCNKIAEERTRVTEKLQKLLPEKCHVYPSEANFIMVYLDKIDSTELTIKLLDHDIFIKDLKTKPAFQNKNFIRLAIRTKEENDRLVQSIASSL